MVLLKFPRPLVMLLLLFALPRSHAATMPALGTPHFPPADFDTSTARPAQPVIFQPELGDRVNPPHAFMSFRELAHPRVGLALSGGGSRCLAQIGVLQALEDNHIHLDFIVGTSMGSFVGGLYAAGYSAAQLHDIAHQIAWQNIMTDTPPRRNLLLSQKQEPQPAQLQIRFRGLSPVLPRALAAGQKVHSLLTELTWRANYWASASFDNLRIPFRAVATDVYSGREVVIDSGDLSEAMRASAALPLLLTPVPRQGMLLVDGGVVNNIPVDVVRRQGMDVVIAVDATSRLRPADKLSAPWEFADQVTTIMQQERNQLHRRLADVLISIGDEPRTSLDFSEIDSLINLGYRRTLAQMDTIRKLCARRHARPDRDRPLVVEAIEVAGATFDPTVFVNMLSNNGAPLMLRAGTIQDWVDSLYASGNYSFVAARLQHDSLAFILRENPRLQAIRFSGNTVYPDSVLAACLKTKPGERINHLQGQEDLNALLEQYRRDGYALADFREVQFDPATGMLQLQIDEGRITDITVEGLRHTRPMVVLREFSLRPGEIFNSTRARRGIDNIHSTGLFESVSLAPLRHGEGGALLIIKVEEKPFGILRLGGYHQSERGISGLIELGNDNVFGIGSRLFLRSTLGSREQLNRLSWRSDRIFRTFLTMSASAFHELRDNFSYAADAERTTSGKYTERRLGLQVTAGQQVRRFGALSGELRWEEVRLRRLYGSGFPIDTEGLTFLTLRSIIDTRDQIPFTRNGRYLHAYYEYAKPADLEADSFVKFFSRLESYQSLGPHTVHTRFIGGIADQTTPFSEQFRVGGPAEIYGLRDQELVGRQLVLGSLEYRYQIRRRPMLDTYVSLRYDFGGVWVDSRSASTRRFHQGLGLAIALDTPLGPVSVALGSFERRETRAYFNLGIPLQ